MTPFERERDRPGNKPALGKVVPRVKAQNAGRSALFLLVGLCWALAACDRKPVPSDGPPSPSPSSSAAAALAMPDAAAPSTSTETVEVPEVRIRTDGDTTVRVTWVTPQDTAVNDEAPVRVRWNRSDGLADAPNDVKSTGNAVKDGFEVKVRPMPGAPNATLGGEINIVVCDSLTHSVCVPVRRSVELGFIAVKDAAEEAKVAIPLPAAK